MGDRDRRTAFDLLAEQRNDGAVRAEHIAETCGDKFGIAPLLRHVLDDHLTGTLGRAHDVGGIDRLIGGDHHKLGGLIFHRQLGDVIGTEDVVLDSFLGNRLHQRHMLVRSCVEYQFRAVLLKNHLHLVVIPDGRDQRDKIEISAVFAHQLLLDLIGAVLVDIDDDHLLGLIGGDLTHQLAADGTAAARHHADLAGDERAYLVFVKFDRLSAEQILYFDFLSLRDQLLTVAEEQFAEVGDHLDFTLCLGAVIEDLALFLFLAGGDRHDDILNSLFLADFWDLGGRSQNRNVADA